MQLTVDFAPQTRDRDKTEIMKYRIYEYLNIKKKELFISNGLENSYQMIEFDFYYDNFYLTEIMRSYDGVNKKHLNPYYWNNNRLNELIKSINKYLKPYLDYGIKHYLREKQHEVILIKDNNSMANQFENIYVDKYKELYKESFENEKLTVDYQFGEYLWQSLIKGNFNPDTKIFGKDLKDSDWSNEHIIRSLNIIENYFIKGA